ncbi:MAG: PspC domain-containing protein [Coriobacteriales bacterium]|jgi:phage shock protein PspC (stress-responsive transcriptional regulator)|nr:PspC domain-containing protein [Coriobacteriales bacterium]
MDSKFDKNNFAIIAGAVLVILGLWQLASHFFEDTMGQVGKIISLALSILGPLVVIAAGILLVIAARRNALNLSNNKKLLRSNKNRKIAGVCGGIASYLGIEVATARITTIVLLIVLPFVILPLYLLFWLIVPADNDVFNTWV